MRWDSWRALTGDSNRPYEVTQAPRHLPYVDPKEIAMLDACRQGDVTFRDQLDNLRPLNKRIRDLQTELGFDVPCPPSQRKCSTEIVSLPKWRIKLNHAAPLDLQIVHAA